MEKNKFEIKVKINQSKQKKTQSGVGGATGEQIEPG